MFTHSNKNIGFLHRLDVRTKLCWFIIAVTITFLLTHPLSGLMTIIFLLVLFNIANIPFIHIRRLIFLLLPILIIMFVVTAFSFSVDDQSNTQYQRVLFYLFPGESSPLTVGGILMGFSLVFRIVIMVMATIILTYTTPVDDFLHFFRKIKVPYSITFIITTAIRFIPTMETKARMVMDAQRSRGAPLGTGSILKRIKSYLPIMIPVIVDSIRMSEYLAVAVLNRGFDATKPYTILEDIELRQKDYVFITAGILIFVISLFLYVHNIGTI